MGQLVCWVRGHDWEVGERSMIYFPFRCRRCGKHKTVVA